MIPLKLTLSGFLSYRDRVEIDFTSFDLACISGSNGAGKSSLLDAITWVLFGQARKRDDSLINLQSDTAEVSLTFAYEGNTYKVLRARTRGKTSLLELHILQASGGWKALSERTQSETQLKIEETLRLDYDTFVNAAFFLQGKADLFTTETPTRRKQILSSILGLDIWEVYRGRVTDRRRQVDAEIDRLDGRSAEIDAELTEETARQKRLSVLQADLKRLGGARKAQEVALEGLRRLAAILSEQARLVESYQHQAEVAKQQLDELTGRRLARQVERQTYAELLSRATQIEDAYQTWQTQRLELSRLEEIAGRNREFENRRTEPLLEIESDRIRLLQEQQMLLLQQTTNAEQQTSLPALEGELATCYRVLAEAEAQLLQRQSLQVDMNLARQNQADARAENPRMKDEMDTLKSRIDQLSISPQLPGGEPGVVENAICPLCGQPLTPADRERLIAELTLQGKDLGDRYRQNLALLKEADQLVQSLDNQISTLASAEASRLAQTEVLARLQSRIEGLQSSAKVWQTGGSPRLTEVQNILAADAFAPEARQRLAEVDAELKALGYDAAAHDLARHHVVAGQAVESEFRSLEIARAALGPLERELSELDPQIARQTELFAESQHAHQETLAKWQASQAGAPDLDAAESALLDMQEQENRLRMEVGAAQQKVLVLDDLRLRRQELSARRETFAQQVTRFRQLDRAMGKDGVPALLIEQALPQIEAKANDLLERLSGGVMSVRFQTQSQYKDKHREDLRETLDILISDSAGSRDYELYSGGEAFRVNFAIRLALSEVLAQRAGARLQTLVIDEGFGSQDALGRQRLVEAINAVQTNFAKILVITHIDELKDSFPSRIEVEKSDRGSTVHVF